jgi:hypothetical protein
MPTSNIRSWVHGAEGVEPHGDAHRRRHRHDVGPAGAYLHHLLSEHRRPWRTGLRQRDARLGVDDPDAVETVGLVALRGRVALALAGDHVHDHRRAVGLGAPQRVLHRLDVVPVDRADVLQPEVLEEPLRGDDVLEALLHPVQRVVDGSADHGGPAEERLAQLEEALVAAGGAQRRQVVRQAADGRGVRPLVVVDDDDGPQVRAWTRCC